MVEHPAPTGKSETDREADHARVMWIPLLINILGYYIVAAYLVLGSMRTILVERERHPLG